MGPYCNFVVLVKKKTTSEYAYNCHNAVTRASIFGFYGSLWLTISIFMLLNM